MHILYPSISLIVKFTNHELSHVVLCSLLTLMHKQNPKTLKSNEYDDDDDDECMDKIVIDFH